MNTNIFGPANPRKRSRLLPLLIWFSATVLGLAQPVITNQPRSLAVLLGSNATFRVTATGTAPLAYQWRSAAGDLIGATNATLTVSNVALSDLGSYTALVSNTAGQTRSQPAWLKLARWTEFVYFGDSECQPPESNGPTWGDYLPDLLCLLSTGKQIYFTGNASEADVRSQILSYLATHKPGTNTLAAVWKGGAFGDLVLGYPPGRAVSNRVANLTRLADAGVTSFLVPKMPGLRLWPAVAAIVSSQTLSNYDRLLDGALSDLAQSHALQFYRPDMKAFEEAIWAAPAAYGFTNLTGNAYGCNRCDPNRYYKWDDFHVTTAANKLSSEFMYGAIVPPLLTTLRMEGTGGLLELQWQGGSPPFQLQHREDLVNGLWQSEELTFQTNAAMAPSAQEEFFRVLHFGQ
jgi:hypothetical protein